ncbi:MAG: glycoside hydrolase family 97 protein [Bacteroidaceae bacterium]|nr:glycoside hydrolase family 97 protein [Bacteroidaceae bacterium]
MRKIGVFCFVLLLFVGTSSVYSQKVIELTSPDGNVVVTVSTADKLRWSLSKDGKPVVSDNVASMKVNGSVLGEKPKLKKVAKKAVNSSVMPVVPMKQAVIENKYNELRLDFSSNWAVEFRAYDDGVAYRFLTKKKGKVQVDDEQCAINLPEDALLHIQQPLWGFGCNYEDPYSHESLKSWGGEKRKGVLPALIDLKDGRKLLFSETDLQDYPCMFLQGTSEHSFTSIFARDPLEFEPGNDRSLKILKEADYIALTNGNRSFPWRWFLIVDEDGQLVENTMPARLAPKCALDDTAWIKPGQVSWDWWNGCYVWGQDVDFVPGRNQKTYQYYLDFASRFGVEYIIMDEYWARDTRNPFEANPQIDLPALIRYGEERGVGIILWLPWLTIENHMELFEKYEKWGIKGVKVDFMDRNDRWMTDFYERAAAEAAKHHLLIDFHGSFKPAGLEYKYPNIISYEAVRGLEWGDNCLPDNSIWLPFIRNSVGTMDFTPGAMMSCHPDNFISRHPNNYAMGTRAYQMALFVVFESGVQMLADSPTNYYQNAECTEFIASVPTTWDETRAVLCQAGELAIVAKRKGSNWYIGGITNGAQRERIVEVPLQFLPEGVNYRMTSFADGPNAGTQAMDYRKNVVEGISSTSVLPLRLVRDGGFVAVLEPEK